MPLAPEVIGRIILARFLSLPPKRYENEINRMKTSNLYRILSSENIIIFKEFPQAHICSSLKGLNKNVLGKIDQRGKDFFIQYRSSGFAGEFQIDRDKLWNLIRKMNFTKSHREEIEIIEKKLRLISTRNRITHMIILGIIEHQTAFLRSYDPLDVTPLNQVQISNWIKDQGYRWIDNSMVSRVTNNALIVILPNEKPMLVKDFFQSSRDIYKRHIKEILFKEEMELKLKRLNRPYSDEEIRIKLKEIYGIHILRRTVSYCRNQMGIPPFHKRAYYNKYPPKWAHFSPHFPMTLASVKENVPEVPGVYELSLVNDTIKYPIRPTSIFYIGSSKNIRKRLRTHLGRWSKNEALKNFIYGERCFLQVFCVQ